MGTEPGLQAHSGIQILEARQSKRPLNAAHRFAMFAASSLQRTLRAASQAQPVYPACELLPLDTHAFYKITRRGCFDFVVG